MPRTDTFTLIRNLDHRVSKIEQILPTLATKDDLREVVEAATAPLATREEMHAAIKAATAPLATREEMHAAIKAATAPLATREEMHAAIKAEGVLTRSHFDTMTESVGDAIKVIAEGHMHLTGRLDTLESGVETDKALVDKRLLRLEAQNAR